MLNITQRQLNLRTYYYLYTGAIDGIEGSGTKKSYKNFQLKTGLVADGIYGTKTDNKLKEVIKDIQNLLNNYGYNLVVDGIIGSATLNAIADFQSKNNLVVDKIVGDATYSKLNSSQVKYNCKYFKDTEFNCPCCGLNLQKNKIKQIADDIREHFGKPAIITSGTRCQKHNKEVGGVAGSYHTTGNAIDIVISGVPASEVLSYCKTIVSSGKARYTYGGTTQMGNATHIDTGGLE